MPGQPAELEAKHAGLLFRRVVMRILLVPFAAAALFATATYGSAAMASHTTTGTVKTYDASAMTIALDNGTVYHLPKNAKTPDVKTGDKVQISWQKSKGTDWAHSVKIVK
jgi:Cu/Ag efflux protein CusF